MATLQIIPVVDVTPASFSAAGLQKGLTIYLKTTDTCQLNCHHCFTSGKHGAKVFFDPIDTITFLSELRDKHPDIPYVTILLHGGEPLLANPQHIRKVWEKTKDFWPNMNWSLQTNLTLRLSGCHKYIIQTICENSFGTSWDMNIRWQKPHLKALWESNVKELVAEGAEVSVMVSVDENVARERPITILNELHALGVSNVMFEKITSHGHAKSAGSPSNALVNDFFNNMLSDAIEHEYHRYIHNATLADLIVGHKASAGVSTHCRDCEQKIFTIGATGAVSGCPNSALEYHYGNTQDGVDAILASPVREQRIFHELNPDTRCLSCPYFASCKGGCHQLQWEGDECPSPKKLFKRFDELANNPILDDIVRGPHHDND